MCSVDVDGLSRGLVSRWNWWLNAISTQTFITRIHVEGEVSDLVKVFAIVNIMDFMGKEGHYENKSSSRKLL